MNKLEEILQKLAKQITEDAVKIAKQEIRETRVSDIELIVKECLKKEPIYQESGAGYLTIDKICEKYKVSKMTVHRKCIEFKVERKRVGKHNLINELEFLKACAQPSSRPIPFDKPSG